MDERFIELAEAAAEKEKAARIAESSAAMVKRPGLSHCEDCGEPIPAERRAARPGVRQCVECASQKEQEGRWKR